MDKISAYGSLWKRILAYGLDTLIVGGVAFVISLIFREQLLYMGGNYWYVGFIVLGAYFSLLNSNIGKGQTIGKRLLGLRVVDLKGHFITIPQAGLRYLVLGLILSNGDFNALVYNALGQSETLGVALFGITLFLIIAIAGLMIINKERRGLHDYLVGTVVIDNKLEKEIKVAKVKSFNEVIQEHKLPFALLILLFLVIIGAAFGIATMIKSQMGSELTGMTDLSKLVERNSEMTGVSINSNTFTMWSNGGSTTTKTLTVSGAVKYAIYKDDALKEKLYQNVGEIIRSNYPSLRDYDKLVIEITTGYNLGIATFYMNDQKAIALNYKNDKLN